VANAPITMGKGRVEAFSDGVIAILITIMVLELKVPHETGLDALRGLAGTFICYVLSFVYIAIYWNNHHHMLHVVRHVNGAVLWANMHLLFWLSLIPFVTGWMSENELNTLPVALYGVVLLLAAVAYKLLQTVLISVEGAGSPLARATGADRKGVGSIILYAIAVPSAWMSPYLAFLLYVTVAIIWLVPDRRIEAVLHERP
jgi:uncharacterized membrane protein